MMRPRRERIYGDNGLIREVDLADNTPIDQLRAEALETASSISSRKLAGIAPDFGNSIRLLFLVLRYCRLLRRAIDENRLSSAEAAALAQIDGLIERADKVRKASVAIETQIAGMTEASAIFDRVESLDRDPLWPE